ncbi:MAG: hypothetical protein QM667_11715 [Asticcacaulis sp.]
MTDSLTLSRGIGDWWRKFALFRWFLPKKPAFGGLVTTIPGWGMVKFPAQTVENTSFFPMAPFGGWVTIATGDQRRPHRGISDEVTGYQRLTKGTLIDFKGEFRLFFRLTYLTRFTNRLS